MIIRVSELEEQGLRIDDVEALGPVFTDPAWRLTAVALEIEPDDREVWVHGRLAATMPQTCSRCLEPFEIPVDSAFELRYVPEVAGAAGSEEREVAEDDLTTAYYKNETLDLGELMHEQFVLALPMKPLCSETCKGLCPGCGTNLNKGTCDCKPSWNDPRLVALQGLLDRQKEN